MPAPILIRKFSADINMSYVNATEFGGIISTLAGHSKRSQQKLKSWALKKVNLRKKYLKAL